METGKPWDIRERAFQFAASLLQLCDEAHRAGGSLAVLSRQLLSSGTSIGANLQEASAGCTRAEFIYRNTLALREARETLYWIRLLATRSERWNNCVEPLRKESDELVSILTAIVKKSRANGSR